MLRRLFSKEPTSEQRPAAAASPSKDTPAFVPPPGLVQVLRISAQARVAPDARGPLACEGIDWNEVGQITFLHECLAPHRADAAEALRVRRADSALSELDALVLFAMVAHLKPTRLMEIGCGDSTHVIRAAMKRHKLPAELIAIDPEPARDDIGEVSDAFLQQPLQELPLSDFDQLQAGEMLLFDTTHVAWPGGEVLHFYQRILPRLRPGVIVGLAGIGLPHENADALRLGQAEQTLAQMFLTGNPHAEVLYAGAWLAEKALQSVTAAMGVEGEAARRSQALWFRPHREG